MSVLRPLCIICNFLGLMPICTKGETIFTRLHKVYCIAVIAYWIWGWTAFTTARFSDEFKSFSVVLTVVDFLVYFILTTTIICIIISTVFWKNEKLKRMFSQLHTLEEEINSDNSTKKAWSIFVLLHLLLFGIITADIVIFWNTLGFNIYKHYMRKQFMWYKINISTFVLYTLTNEIESKFRVLNNAFLRTGKKFSRNSEIKWGNLIIPYIYNEITPKDLERIRRLYDSICDVVDDFNEVFGVVLLFQVVNNIGHILFYTLVLLEINVLPCQLLSVLWLLLNLSHTMLLAAACDGLANEANRTTTICYLLLNDVPVTPKTYYQKLLKEEVLLLAKQSASRQPHISAAGFFTVNFTMMGFIVSSVTSYIIVSIQFLSG